MPSAHTGQSILRNPALLQSIAESLRNGLGAVETAKAHHVAPETLSAALAKIRNEDKSWELSVVA